MAITARHPEEMKSPDAGVTALHRRRCQRTTATVSAALLAASLACRAQAQTPTPAPPDVVRVPTGLNFGFTTYYDAFGATDRGAVTLIGYGRHQWADEITGPDGRASPQFRAPRIDVDVAIVQVVYVAHELSSGAIGLNVVQPVVNLDARFETPGVVLHDNGLGLGDTTFGVLYQSKPITSGKRPVFAWRAEMDVVAPSGSFNSTKDLNQGSGYWSLNPFVAVTYVPTPKLEVSSRANYLYGFATSRAPNPAPFSALPFRNGQAGQLFWLNFDASYEVAPGFSLGTSGYYETQLTDDRYDGLDVPHSRAEALYLGPGFHWAASKTDILNANFYFPLSSRNLAQGREITLQYIRPF